MGKMRQSQLPQVEIESAWEEETKTLRQTIRLYFPPIALRHKPRAERPGKVKIYSKEEILSFRKEPSQK